ncbi:MAG: metallophosphoesterase [Clostridiales bacterium]|nr:MAG: metallophosphoesterase [Clostridiales bacterium]
MYKIFLLKKIFFCHSEQRLKNSEILFFCGTRGWTLPESNKTPEDEKVYNREVIRYELSLKEATKLKGENDKIIAMLHYPPFELNNADTAFTDLSEKYGVEKVVYGHLHGRYGRTEILHEKKTGWNIS